MRHATCCCSFDHMQGIERPSSFAHASLFDLKGLWVQNIHLSCPIEVDDLGKEVNARILSLVIYKLFTYCDNHRDARLRPYTVVITNHRMPYHHYGFMLRREHSREGLRINLGQYLSCNTGNADENSDCDCIKCQSKVIRERAAQHGPFFPAEPRLVQQNIIRQNINLVPGSQGLRRRASRPDFPLLNANYFDQWSFQDDRCVHGFDPAGACPLCADQRGRARSRHANHDEDDLYNIDRAINESRKAYEEQQKKQNKAQETQDKKLAERHAELYGISKGKADSTHVLPNLFRQNNVLEQRKKEIRREIEQCDADLKRLHEGAAREAQFRGHHDREAVLEQEQACRMEELRCDWAAKEATEIIKKQPRSILVNKRVRFLGRIE